MSKFLGVVDAPSAATHVQVHTVTETGAIGAMLRLQVRENEWADTYPIRDVSAGMVAGAFGAGVYRFTFWSVDGEGKKKRIGNATGGIRVDAPPPVDGAPRKKKKATGMTEGGVLELYMTISSREEARAREFYAQQSQRDREYFSSILTALRGPSLTAADIAKAVKEAREDDDEEEEEEDKAGELGDAAVKVLKFLGDRAEPFLKDLVAKKEGGA